MATGNVLTDANKRHAPAQDGDVNTLRGKLVVNQGTADDEILALKSSDVAHGVTTMDETDTYFSARKRNAGSGGVVLRAINEDPSVNIEGVILQGIQAAVSTVKSNVAPAAVVIDGKKTNGTGVTTLGADANILAVSDNDAIRFIRQWLEEPAHRLVLEKYRLVTFNEDGHHFVNMSRLTMLLVGAVRQMGAALHAMALGMEQLGRRMRALEAGT